MTDAIDAGTSTAPEASGAAQGQTPTPQAPAGGGHPAWDTMRSAIGDSTFTLIRPHLEQYDKAAQERITALNGQVDSYKEFGGVDQIRQWQQLANAINEDPQGFYTRFGELINQGQEPQAGAEDEGPFTADEGEEDPRIAALQQQQQALMDQFQQQEFERAVSEQSGLIDSQLAQIRQANPWMNDDDQNEIVQRAQGHLQRGAEDPLQAAATELIGLRSRYLSAPRANDGAPKLIPSGGGGNPAAGQPQSTANMTPVQRQALVQSMLTANR